MDSIQCNSWLGWMRLGAGWAELLRSASILLSKQPAMVVLGIWSICSVQNTIFKCIIHKKFHQLWILPLSNTNRSPTLWIVFKMWWLKVEWNVGAFFFKQLHAVNYNQDRNHWSIVTAQIVRIQINNNVCANYSLRVKGLSDSVLSSSSMQKKLFSQTITFTKTLNRFVELGADLRPEGRVDIPLPRQRRTYF